MPGYSVFALLIAALLIFTPLDNAAQPNAAYLHAGDLFPKVSGRTLTGELLELPTASSDKPTVVVFSFSRTAGKDARLWNEHLFRGRSDAVPCYQVVVLETVPKLFRGIAMSGMRSSMPVPMQDRAIALYHDEKLWKLRLAASDSNRAYVVLLRPDGHIRWNNSGLYSDSEYAQLNSEIQKLLQVHR